MAETNTPAPAGVSGDTFSLKARYTRPYVAHASMAPSCAIALFKDGQLTIRSHGQGMHPLRKNLAQALGLPIEAITAQHLHGPAACVFPRKTAAPGQPGHPAELLHHLLHLHELLQQPVHFLDRRAAALRDALAAAAVDDVLLSPLFGRHRPDDRLDARQLLFIRRLSRHLLQVAHAGQHAQNLL